MKKVYFAILVVLVLAVIPAVAFAGPPAHAISTARLHPANESGIKGAVITFTDNGAGSMTIHEEATGLSGGEVSLLYDDGSVPGGPGTPEKAKTPSAPVTANPPMMTFVMSRCCWTSVSSVPRL